ncbi:MAG: amino acid adenylation domain-containing protein [Saccharothrix sp.]|nr:amino acid adenylation domain-containing protein [Saccharothrix sp.]
MFTDVESLNGVLIEAAKSRPAEIAISDTRTSLTYDVLRRRVTSLAADLAGRGVRKGDLVGLLVERTVDVVVGMLAILRCGGVYVPIDPTYPVDRRDYLVRDSGVAFVVGSAAALAATGLDPAVRTRALDAPAVEDGGFEPPAVGPDDPAYVIYTSGSTGAPKGCVVTHGNVLSLLRHALPLFDVDGDDRWSVFHSFSFDFSVWELWGALATGARAVVLPLRATRLPADLVAVLAEEGVTVLCQVPSVFRHFTSLRMYPAARLRYVVFGGESVDLGAVGRFWARCDGARPRVVNMYGITETTVHSTFRPITEADLAGRVRSPIGVPLPHLSVELRDQEPPHRPVPDGEVGEMWIAGAGVARGYLGRPDLTARRFVVDDLSGTATRYYRSGDLARRLPDGGLEYLGRNDDQVKLRGFRVELGEVESVVRAHDGVLDAAACVVSRRAGSSQLVACVVPATRGDHDLVTRIRDRLASQLPKHLLPDRYVLVDALPLTPSGKLDRTGLADLATA